MRKLWWSVTINDCDIQHFSVGGPGGGGKDTSNTGVRIVHRASGATGEGREERSQVQNLRAAWRRMAASSKFKTWHRMECARRAGEPSIDTLVYDAMRPVNLKIEVRDGSAWNECTCGLVADECRCY